MKILIDCFGPDLGPGVMVEGASLYAKEYQIVPIFIGDEKAIQKEVDKYSFDEYEIIHTETCIENTEEPTRAIRKKKDSSLVQGLGLLKAKKADAFLSAGSTGALLAGGLFIVGRKEGVQRACLPAPIPRAKGYVSLLDAGANVDCSAEILYSFAKMGSSYAKSVYGIKEPSVYLLNIGSEEGKGNRQTKESFTLLKEDKEMNFRGNLEARDVLLSDADVLVCDGFVGNIFLKTMEGFAGFLFQTFQGAMEKESSIDSANPLTKNIAQLKKMFDYKEIGAVPLLGLNELVFKAHGSSNAKAIYSSLKQISQAINSNLLEEI